MGGSRGLSRCQLAPVRRGEPIRRVGCYTPYLSSPIIVVVAAVIERDDHFLLTLRPAGTHLEGHWEFPGGKCSPTETHAEALRRELLEELDIVGDVHERIHTATHHYPERIVELHFYRCGFDGDPKPMMGQGLQWVHRTRLRDLPFPDADARLIELLTS